MKTIRNEYISPICLRQNGVDGLFRYPYRDGIDNFKVAFLPQKKAQEALQHFVTSLPCPKVTKKMRLRHFFAGFGLVLPLINTISVLALRRFCTKTVEVAEKLEVKKEKIKKVPTDGILKKPGETGKKKNVRFREDLNQIKEFEKGS